MDDFRDRDVAVPLYNLCVSSKTRTYSGGKMITLTVILAVMFVVNLLCFLFVSENISGDSGLGGLIIILVIACVIFYSDAMFLRYMIEKGWI